MQTSYTWKENKNGRGAKQGKHNGPIPTYGYRYTEDREWN